MAAATQRSVSLPTFHLVLTAFFALLCLTYPPLWRAADIDVTHSIPSHPNSAGTLPAPPERFSRPEESPWLAPPPETMPALIVRNINWGREAIVSVYHWAIAALCTLLFAGQLRPVRRWMRRSQSKMMSLLVHDSFARRTLTVLVALLLCCWLFF